MESACAIRSGSCGGLCWRDVIKAQSWRDKVKEGRKEDTNILDRYESLAVADERR